MPLRTAHERCSPVRMRGNRGRAPAWGRDAVGMVLDAGTDWEEVRELLIESFCVQAPKKLVALIDRPGEDHSPGPDAPRP